MNAHSITPGPGGQCWQNNGKLNDTVIWSLDITFAFSFFPETKQTAKLWRAIFADPSAQVSCAPHSLRQAWSESKQGCNPPPPPHPFWALLALVFTRDGRRWDNSKNTTESRFNIKGCLIKFRNVPGERRPLSCERCSFKHLWWHHWGISMETALMAADRSGSALRTFEVH